MADLLEPDVELRWRGKETRVKTFSLLFQAAYIPSGWDGEVRVGPEEQMSSWGCLRQGIEVTE